jgi:carbonic anhydrase/acetyltransferase-like protein (isoleucine patch superfamily)
MGHRVLCHALSVGDGATLANGCIVNNDAVIGAYSVVASGAVVLDRAEVPAEVFVVGTPAQVKGQVTDAHKERFKSTADHYVELGQMHKKAGLDDREVNAAK